MRLQPLNTGAACLLALAFHLSPACAETPRLVVLQDEPQDLPAENKALFSASREVSIQLDLLAAIPQDNFGETVVTVVRPSGETTKLSPSSTGTVTVNQVEAGPHAIVAAGKKHHGSTLVYLEPQPEPDAADEPVATPPVRMTLLQVSPKNLVGFVRNDLDVDSAGPLSGLKDSVTSGPSFGYRVRLGENGKLQGRVFSVMSDNAAVNVAGTRIVILYQGSPVASTTCDALGNWEVMGIRPGVHGIIAAGPAGYAAFAFEAAGDEGFVLRNDAGMQLVMKVDEPAQKLPVVLIPPPMIPYVVDAINDYYQIAPPLIDPSATGIPLDLAMPGLESSASSTGDGGFGGSSSSGLGGLRGLGAAGVAAAIAIPLAVSDDDAPGIVVTRDR